MDYFQFEERIKQLVSSASEAARYRFGRDTIRLLHRAAWDTFWEEFSDEARPLLADILADIDIQSTDELKEKVKRLRNSMEIDPDDFIPEITDLLNAIDNWLAYRATRNPRFIERIAIDMVNSLDYYIGGDTGEYSTDNMLGAPEMREEFHRQAHFLAGE
ncbi:MAG: hypothetical protein HYX68_12285 [Planctomycetes bacterium]|nr:hypothetical protein [Planctomycetota bacterium]